MHNTTMF